jgi:hypothetical protein
VGTVRRTLAVVVDTAGAAVLLALAVRLGWAEGLQTWLRPDPWLPFPESALVRLARHPLALWELLWLLSLPFMLWHALWGGLLRTTPGQWLLGVVRVDAFGWPASPLRMLARALALGLWPLTLGAAPLWALLSPAGRGLDDQLCGLWPVDRWRRRA